MAASSVLSQIEDLIGDVAETTAVNEWASDTAREVINILPQDMYGLFLLLSMILGLEQF